MARRVFSFPVRSEGGTVLGGSATELRIYDDAALTTLSTIYAAETGAGTIPNPRIPNAGRQTALLADRAAGDAYVTVVDITGFNVGDLIPIYNGTATVYRVITLITAGTRRLDLAATLGTAFLAANTVVGNLDMRGHVYGWLDDVRDYYMQAKNVASGRVLAPIGIPVRVPATTLTAQEEGTGLTPRGTINFIGAGVTAADDAANARTNVTISSPSGAAFADHSAQHDPGGSDPLAGTDVQVFTASGTWTKPVGARAVRVIAIGGGGNGGAGTTGGSGSGGGGGARQSTELPAASCGATETVTVGAAGGASSFGALLIAYGGGAGISGNLGSAGSGGGASSGGSPGINGANNDTGGGPTSTASLPGSSRAGSQGAGSIQGAAGGNAEHGGAGGGGINNASVGAAGGSSLRGGGGGGGGGQNGNTGAAGGASGSYVAGGGGTANGGSGGSRTGTGRAANGGGGGNAGVTGTAGGAGGIPGGGGGGGGMGTTTPGAAGAGGRGEVIVVTYF